MRFVLVLVFATACGPLNVAGNWTATIDAGGSGQCTGAMALTQSGDDIGGGWGCGGFTGAITGVLAGDDVSLALSATGYAPILVTANVSGSTMAGVANGSGYSGSSFTASRQ